MNNIMATKTGFIVSKEVKSLITDGGKYGCIAFAVYTLYALCVKAIKKGYAFNVNLTPEGNVSFNFTPYTVIER